MPLLDDTFVPIVVGRKGSLRNPSLVEVFGDLLVFSPPVYVDSQTKGGARFIEWLLNGRTLNVGERGAAQAHYNARLLGSKFATPWVLIMEDDAKLDQAGVQEIVSQLRKLDPAENLVIIFRTSLPASVRRKDDPLAPQLIRGAPSGAVASIFSHSALASAKSSKLRKFEVADWPSSFADTKFLMMPNIYVDGVGDSRIGERRANRASYALSLVSRLLLTPVIAIATKTRLNACYRWLVLRPLIRDLRLESW